MMARPRSETPRRAVSVRLSDEERAVLAAKAAEAGVTLTEFVRIAALGRQLPIRDPNGKAVVLALSRIGGNLNQIARALNRNDPVTVAAITALIVELRDAVQRVGR